MDFHSNYSCEGFWRLSTSDETQHFFGKLEYSNETGISLLVFGSFYETLALGRLKGPVQEKCIYGVSNKGEFLTLLDCILYESGYQYGLIQTRITAKYFIKGTHLSEKHLSNISILNAHLPLLTRWYDKKSGFKHKIDKTGSSITLRYKQPKPVTLFENDEIGIYFYFEWNTGFAGTISMTSSISERIFLNIQFKKSADLLSGIDQLIFIKKFFSLFSMYDFRFDEVNGFTQINQANESFKILFKDEGRYYLPLDNFNIAIFYSEINTRIPSMLKKWITNREMYDDIFGYYFDIKHRLVTNQRNIFLNLCFSLERFHKAFFDRHPFNPKKLNTLKSVLNKAPNKFKKRLDAVMSHFNELSFAQRLQDLINKNKSLVAIFILNADKFNKIVPNTRNSLVHKTNTKRKDVISTENLLHYNNALVLILEISLLYHFKVSNEIIKKFIDRDFSVHVIKKNLPSK